MIQSVLTAVRRQDSSLGTPMSPSRKYQEVMPGDLFEMHWA